MPTPGPLAISTRPLRQLILTKRLATPGPCADIRLGGADQCPECAEPAYVWRQFGDKNGPSAFGTHARISCSHFKLKKPPKGRALLISIEGALSRAFAEDEAHADLDHCRNALGRPNDE